MRLSVCTTAITCATLFATAIAAPTTIANKPDEKTPVQQAEEIGRRDDHVVNKYFKEPGYVDVLYQPRSRIAQRPGYRLIIL